MKKVLFALVAVAMIAASCSKESKLNRKLDGTWNVQSFGGVALAAGQSMSITFSKEKKGKGTYSMTQTFPPLPAYTDGGTYTLVEDKTMYMLSSTAGSTQDTLTVTAYSKTDLTLTSTDLTAIVLKKE